MITYALASLALRTISLGELRRWTSGGLRRGRSGGGPLVDTPLDDIPVLATSMLGPVLESVPLSESDRS